MESRHSPTATNTYLFGSAGNRLHEIVGYLGAMIALHGDSIEEGLHEKRYYVEDDLTEVLVQGEEWRQYMSQQSGWRLLSSYS